VALYPDLSGLENLRFWGRMYGLAGRELGERVEATLEVVGLTERAGDKVAAYSGGMQRRLNIAAGLLHRPRLLVLDEPTAGVDPQSRNAILSNVEALGGEGWPCSTPPTTWRRRSGSATGSASSTRVA
jgi:ABC-2 type transport system ATP-binding protein